MSQTPTDTVEDPITQTPPAAQEGDYQHDQRFLNRVIEGAILAHAEALSIEKLFTLFDEDKRPTRKQITDTLIRIRDSQHDRGFILKEVASGWRFEVCDDLAPWVNRLWDERPQKYSRALLETLSLIAYRQPLTRGDIEDVRGVAVSSNIIKTLSEREWIKVVGHRDVPGRPALYATTRQFLDYFGLNSLEQLPSLAELQGIDSISAKLDLGDKARDDKSSSAVPVSAEPEPAKNRLDENDDKKQEEVVDSEAPHDEHDHTALTQQTHFDPDIAQHQRDATTLSAADSTEPLKKTEV